MSAPRTVVLIACSSRKLGRPDRAERLYRGTLFRASLDWAHSKDPDAICILSARHGLVDLDQEIAPYDLTLNKLPVDEVRAWAENVFRQLTSRFDPRRDRFVFLAGERYRRFLVPRLAHVELPLTGLTYGQQVSWLQGKVARQRQSPPQSGEEVSDACQVLHEWANSLPRQRFPLEMSRVPANGLYILFEHGEQAHGGDRIVRIGTHTGDGNLPARLREHFETENKDRSIFRKNIGRALLANEDRELLEQWNRDLTTRAAREHHGATVEGNALKEVEARVSAYMRERFSCVVYEKTGRDDRLRLEQGLIGTVANCPGCKPSGSWLGNRSPIDAIRDSGLWQVHHLSARPFSAAEVAAMSRSGNMKPRPTSNPRQAHSPAERTRRKGKYGPLKAYLESASNSVSMAFGEVGRVLGAPLPASARDYRPWWANHEGANKSPQSRAWQDAGFRVASVRLGHAGSVRFERVGEQGPRHKASHDPDRAMRVQACTHGGRARRFVWLLDDDTLDIESESGMSHSYTVREVLTILQMLHAHFRDNWFPLANNVEKLYHGTERYGLGGAIHQQRPGDTLHAQGASYLGVVLEQAGIFEWNGKAREIQWRIRRMPENETSLLSSLTSVPHSDESGQQRV